MLCFFATSCGELKIVSKQFPPNFFIFLPRTLIGRITAAIRGSGVPPQEEYPPPRQIPGYAYAYIDRLVARSGNVQYPL